jgi:hypothetical protein
MIVDLNIGGVLIPGLVVLAFVALLVAVAMIRFFSTTGIQRLFVSRALVELATFVIIYGLLLQSLPLIGLLP